MEPTKIVSIQPRGGYTRVEVHADEMCFKLSFDKLHNLVAINRLDIDRKSDNWSAIYTWHMEFHHYFKRVALTPVHIDIVVTALEAMKNGVVVDAHTC